MDTYKPLEYQYSIKECVIREAPLGSTANMVTLFHHDKHDCGNPFVDLQLTWVDHQFRIRHRAFVFTGQRQMIGVLECKVKVCELNAHETDSRVTRGERSECDNVKYSA